MGANPNIPFARSFKIVDSLLCYCTYVQLDQCISIQERDSVIKIIVTLLQFNANICHCNEYGTPVYCYLAMIKDERVLEQIRMKLSQISTSHQNKTGYTVLHYASMFENYPLLEILLPKSSSSDRSLIDRYGNTPIHYIASSKDKNINRILELYFQTPSDVKTLSTKNIKNLTPLDISRIINKNGIMFKYLSKYKCKTDFSLTEIHPNHDNDQLRMLNHVVQIDYDLLHDDDIPTTKCVLSEEDEIL